MSDVEQKCLSDESLLEQWRRARERHGLILRASPERVAPQSVMEAIDSGRYSAAAPHTLPPRLDSRLEEDFARHLVKHLSPSIVLLTQQRVGTPAGTFRLDFLLRSSSLAPLAIETDGSAFHEPIIDAWRDAAILGTGSVRDIIRIQGRDIFRHPHDVLYVLSRLIPGLVTERGERVLELQASNAARCFRSLEPGEHIVDFPPPRTEGVDEASTIHAQRSLRLLASGYSGFSGQRWRFRFDLMSGNPRVALTEWARAEAEYREQPPAV